ncbi:MAG: hypothetical protein ACRYGR_09430 [Janthinobacterium lividum]
MKIKAAKRADGTPAGVGEEGMVGLRMRIQKDEVTRFRIHYRAKEKGTTQAHLEKETITQKTTAGETVTIQEKNAQEKNE